MPDMDGLELSSRIKSSGIKSKVVIISGYGEFSYAKKALEYGVINYLLKPVDIQELKDTLSRVKNNLEMEYQRDELLEMQREQFFVELFMGALVSEDEISGRISGLGFPFTDIIGSFIEVSINNYDYFDENTWSIEQEKINRIIQNIIMKMINGSVVFTISHDAENLKLVLIGEITEQDIYRIKLQALEMLKIDFDMAILYKFNGVNEILERNIVVDNENESIIMLMSYIRLGEKDEALKLLGRMISTNIENKPFIKKISNLIKEAFGIAEYQAAGSETENIVLTIKNSNYENNNNIINEIIEFIEKNINKEISRCDVAGYVNLNEVYMARLFKRSTGISIHDYHLEKRMKKAIEMLGDNNKVAYISNKLGYIDKRKFIRNFKSYTGYSPMEFKNKILKMED